VANILRPKSYAMQSSNPTTGEAERAIHLATELLLQLPDEPGVDLLEGLAQAVGNVDDHSLPVPGNVNLAAKRKPSSPTRYHNHISTLEQINGKQPQV
jgi:hypothetical protein